MRYPFKPDDLVGWEDPSIRNVYEEITEYVQEVSYIYYERYNTTEEWKRIPHIWKKTIFSTKVLVAIFGKEGEK